MSTCHTLYLIQNSFDFFTRDTENAVEAMEEEDGSISYEDTTRQREVGGTEEEPGEEEDLRPAEHEQSEPAAGEQPPELTSSPSPPTPTVANRDANPQGCTLRGLK